LIYANNANYEMVSINGTQIEFCGKHVVWRWGKQERECGLHLLLTLAKRLYLGHCVSTYNNNNNNNNNYMYD
jgi:hypothetical protein